MQKSSVDPDHDGPLGVGPQRRRPHVDEEAVLLAHRLPVARQRLHLGAHAAEAARVADPAPAQRLGRRGPTPVADGRSGVGHALEGVGAVLLQESHQISHTLTDVDPTCSPGNFLWSTSDRKSWEVF